MMETKNVKSDVLPVCAESGSIKFNPSSSETCQQFGEELASPEECYATGKCVEIAEVGEKTTVVLHITNMKGKGCTTPVECLTCELVSNSTGQKVDCLVRR